MKRYTHHDMHQQLLTATLSDRYKTADQIGSQAIHCPYYVTLEGTLGSDWGVILNPESSRFALLTFEHDDCGCPISPTEDDAGWGRHDGNPTQDGDMWDVRWRHVCDPDWCDPDCEDRESR